MENPATWNEPTKIIMKAVAEAERLLQERVIGLSSARQIHDALEATGWLRTPEEREKAHKE